MATKTATITAQNTYSDAYALRGYFNFSLSGAWVAIVTVQRSFDSGVTWRDVDTFTENCEMVGYEPQPDVYYRFGVKTGNFTSGSISGRLGK